MSVWALILLIGVITFALRLSFIWWLGRVEVPDLLRRILAYVPAAVLAALVVPALAFVSQGGQPAFQPERVLAGLLATAVAWRTKSIFWTIASGMASLWLLQLVL